MFDFKHRSPPWNVFPPKPDKPFFKPVFTQKKKRGHLPVHCINITAVVAYITLGWNTFNTHTIISLKERRNERRRENSWDVKKCLCFKMLFADLWYSPHMTKKSVLLSDRSAPLNDAFKLSWTCCHVGDPGVHAVSRWWQTNELISLIILLLWAW